VSWRLTFSRNAQKSLRRLPPDVRRRLDGVFGEMMRDPLSGDVVVLRDYPVGYRRRVGPYRVLFDVEPSHAQRSGPGDRTAHVDHLPQAAMTPGHALAGPPSPC
jgi:mRNA-degrading endonuclease RelE of RelBE toxin-antitoxin system